MEIKYLPLAEEHLKYWRKSGNKQVQKKISSLIVDILKTPYAGIGKPEELKHELAGSWSRRITDEHRIVYQITENDTLEIQRLKGHYGDK
jgi:toxin YoeB